jgi:DNA-binding winged helix-turn-helix (wHTH) protein/Tfp pilus assembly protein PilF
VNSAEHGGEVNRYTFGDWILDSHCNQLQQGKRVVALEHRHTSLLMYLLASNHKVLTKDDIIRAVWHNKVVNDESLAVAISQLRKALDDDARTPKYIKTIPGIGYQFISAARLASSLPDKSTDTLAALKKLPIATAGLVLTASLALLLGMSLVYLRYSTNPHPVPPAMQLDTNSDKNSLENELAQRAFAGLHAGQEHDWRQAITLLRQLLEKQPDNAKAYLGIAEAKMKLLGDKVVAPENYPEVSGLLRKALELDPSLARAHLWLANLLVWHDHSFAEAENHYKASLTLSPYDAVIQSHYTHFLMVQKRFQDARQQLGNLRELDPLHFSETNLVWLYLLEGNYQKAEQELERIAKTEEGDEFFHQAAQNVYFHLGDEIRTYQHIQWFYPKAGFSAEKIALLNSEFTTHGLQGVYRWLLENKEMANLGQFTPPISWARYAVATGQKNLALAYLEQAFQERNFHTECAAADPLYSPLYNEQRFKELLVPER